MDHLHTLFLEWNAIYFLKNIFCDSSLCKYHVTELHNRLSFFCGSPSDIFSLFASDSGNHATREDMEGMLQTMDGEIPLSLRKCFSEVRSYALVD